MASPYLTAPMQGGKYYHVFKTSSHEGPIFYTPANYLFFLKRFQTQLGPMVDLVAYCLMPDRFHLVFYAREVITIKEEYVDHPGDIGHFVAETMRKMFNAYNLALIKQEGLAQETALLDHNFYRYELLGDDAVKRVITEVHHLAVAAGLSEVLGQYLYDSMPALTAKGKTVVDKDLVFSLFGDREQFISAQQQPIGTDCSPLFSL